jgi:shikimate kinase
MEYRNLIITGFMGSGKSTIGRCLAEKLSLPFLETDTELLKDSEYSSIAQIIAEKGEAYFRKLEHRALKKLLKNPDQVISLGGGTICQDNIPELFHPDDCIIYLDVPFEECARRIREQKKNKNTPKRPLFSDETSAHELFRKREPIYKNRSRLRIPAESGTPGEVATRIISTLLQM